MTAPSSALSSAGLATRKRACWTGFGSPCHCYSSNPMAKKSERAKSTIFFYYYTKEKPNTLINSPEPNPFPRNEFFIKRNGSLNMLSHGMSSQGAARHGAYYYKYTSLGALCFFSCSFLSCFILSLSWSSSPDS